MSCPCLVVWSLSWVFLGILLMRLLRYLMVFLRIRYCTHPFARRFSPWDLGTGEGLGLLSHTLTVQCSGADEGHHSLPEEVNDRPKEVRRRLRGKTPIHQVDGREASPPPKRRKWPILPGPSRGSQEDGRFPRVGVG